jgi:hypothetical protein
MINIKPGLLMQMTDSPLKGRLHIKVKGLGIDRHNF